MKNPTKLILKTGEVFTCESEAEKRAVTQVLSQNDEWFAQYDVGTRATYIAKFKDGGPEGYREYVDERPFIYDLENFSY